MDTLFAERMETVFNELTQYMELYSQTQYNEEYPNMHEQIAEYDVIADVVDAETVVCTDIFEVASDISDNDSNYVIYYNYDI